MINPKLNQIPIAPAANAPAQARSLTESVMKSFSASKRTASLQQTLAAPATRQRLRKYSITTLEEAIGIARVKPAALSQVVSPETVEALRSDDARHEAAEFSEIARLLPDFEKRPHAFGARLGASAPPNLFGALEQDARTAPPPAVPELSLVGDACMPPIRNQGQRGTCVAFATAALAEYELCRRTGNKHDFSEQFHYWNCKCNDGLLPPYTSDGTIPAVSYALLKRDGICEEQVWPYTPNDPPQNDPHVPPAQAAARQFRARSATDIQQYQNVDVLKMYLRQNQLISIAIPVYDSWYQSANAELTGNITMPLPGENADGGHALVLAGYGDNDDFAGAGYFIVRNSWGTQWASRSLIAPGYGTIPYDYIRNENESAFVISY